MPLPFIIGAVAVAAVAGYGAKKGYDAYKDSKEVEYWHKKAKDRYDKAQDDLDDSSYYAHEKFEEFGELKAKVVQNGLHRYAEIVDKLDIANNVNLRDIVGHETLDRLNYIQESIVNLETAIGGVVAAGAAGAMAGFGAFGAVGLLASASTGTAISTLSGVAATNAALAWFGGGSLAAGGLGMAGGTLVLGGIVVAPVIAVAASVFAASAEKKKYEARAYYDSVRGISEAMKAQVLMWEEIAYKADEKRIVLRKYKKRFFWLLDSVEEIMENKGLQVSEWEEDEQRKVKTLMQIAESVVAVINAPIMSDNDETTRKLKAYQQNCQKLMNELQEKWGDKQ